MNLTAHLEVSAAERTSYMREEYWARIQSNADGPFTDVRRSVRDGMTVLERTSGPPSALPIGQRYVHVHLVRDDVWIDVHLSKAKYTSQE